ncbi:hypothetical protein BDW42DRAFT_159778 [Aspergillus taichungensis]|uniref:Uncharacterized protein n=1 Tax=Aspergillus taichungensis TaxID=482145 RepID=A0A2J5I7J1_9EURO|nr:hypothetical protein BDW42DRAFT_159778 [Aspergillus taichungensis]
MPSIIQLQRDVILNAIRYTGGNEVGSRTPPFTSSEGHALTTFAHSGKSWSWMNRVGN